MRSASRTALLVAAIALPIAIVFGSFALTSNPRQPSVPAEVRVGGSTVPSPQQAPSGEPSRPGSAAPPAPPRAPPSGQPPGGERSDDDDDDELMPPPPDDRDDRPDGNDD